MMGFEVYLKGIPNLHSWDGGKTWNTGGFEAPELRQLYEFVHRCGSEEATILETGAGNSTLAFLYARPKKLIAIAPDSSLRDRILGFCEVNGIDPSLLDFYVERSEWVLPELARSGLKVDLALIDGGHGWPTVFVDFCYINSMLRCGGILILDDIDLYSVKELGRLLERDTYRFNVMMEFGNGKSIAFTKLTDEQFLDEWTGQPYIVEQSRERIRGLVRR